MSGVREGTGAREGISAPGAAGAPPATAILALHHVTKSFGAVRAVTDGTALSLDARAIVMDEPTAALSATEVARLFDVVRTLRSAGAAVLFISHRLEEVFEICQRVTVMRDGRHVLTSELAGLTADDLVRAMVGRQMEARVAGERGHGGQRALAGWHGAVLRGSRRPASRPGFPEDRRDISPGLSLPGTATRQRDRTPPPGPCARARGRPRDREPDQICCLEMT